jgi:cytochrome c5
MKNFVRVLSVLILFLTAGACNKGGQAPENKAEAPQATGQVQEQAKAAAPAESSAPASVTTQSGATEGEQIFNKVCVVCHGEGFAGAPKLGDKEAWQARINQGMETLVNHAIHGYHGSQGSMPAKGGDASLTDDEVKAAVAYMVEKSS